MMSRSSNSVPEVYTSVEALMRLEAYARLPEFTSVRRSRSVQLGQHHSRLRGRGLDFDQLRRYDRGDDIRHLDWRVTQRTGVPYVRSFTEERDRPTLILCDQRMDMFFGSSYLLKSTAAAEAAALLAWVALQAGDRVGGSVFNDQLIEVVSPHRSRQRVCDLLTRIARQNQALSSDNSLARSAGQLDKVISGSLANAYHDQTLCIVSDFAGISERTLALLQQLSFHNNVIAIQIYDPLALSLPRSGVTQVVEDQVEVSLDLGHNATRNHLEAFLQQRFNAVDELLRRSQVAQVKISTGQPIAAQLAQALPLLTGARA